MSVGTHADTYHEWRSRELERRSLALFSFILGRSRPNIKEKSGLATRDYERRNSPPVLGGGNFYDMTSR